MPEGFDSPTSNNSNLDFSPRPEVGSAFKNMTLDEAKQDDHTSPLPGQRQFVELDLAGVYLEHIKIRFKCNATINVAGAEIEVQDGVEVIARSGGQGGDRTRPTDIMLETALEKGGEASTAVLLDNEQDFEGALRAVQAYLEAWDLL
jgi:hypothetical protein